MTPTLAPLEQGFKCLDLAGMNGFQYLEAAGVRALGPSHGSPCAEDDRKSEKSDSGEFHGDYFTGACVVCEDVLGRDRL